MKLLFKTILKYYLKYITKLVLLIHRPIIIAIAGSVNKTFVKQEILRVLKKQGVEARANPKSFNTEIGLPLAILNLTSGYNSYKNWLPTIYKALASIFQRNFPKYLILELGISNLGDMKFLLSIIKPKVVIITDITQRYLESFSDMDELVGEYYDLVKKIKKTCLMILNYDNIRIKKLAKASQAQVKFFGLDDGADWQAIKIIKNKDGQTIGVSHKNIINYNSIKRFGQHHVYCLLIGIIIKDYVKKQ